MSQIDLPAQWMYTSNCRMAIPGRLQLEEHGYKEGWLLARVMFTASETKLYSMREEATTVSGNTSEVVRLDLVSCQCAVVGSFANMPFRLRTRMQ